MIVLVSGLFLLFSCFVAYLDLVLTTHFHEDGLLILRGEDRLILLPLGSLFCSTTFRSLGDSIVDDWLLNLLSD